MYLSYYGLKRTPFQITSDPRFLWLGETHREALATLEYGLYEDKSFLMLTGDVGCGKTTLINSFVGQLKDNVVCAVLGDPGLSLMDLFNHISFLFGMEHTFDSKGAFIIAFTRFLNKTHDAGRRVLLIIDEAQRITAEHLEEICMLSNIERQNTKLINIFFVGQHEFREMVSRHPNRSLKQKLTFNCRVGALDASDLNRYIRHRLKIAGTAEPLFDDAAVSLTYRYSGGNPRVTNIICDLCLLTGFVQEKNTIDDGIVLECVEELQLPVLVVNDPQIFPRVPEVPSHPEAEHAPEEPSHPETGRGSEPTFLPETPPCRAGETAGADSVNPSDTAASFSDLEMRAGTAESTSKIDGKRCVGTPPGPEKYLQADLPETPEVSDVPAASRVSDIQEAVPSSEHRGRGVDRLTIIMAVLGGVVLVLLLYIVVVGTNF